MRGEKWAQGDQSLVLSNVNHERTEFQEVLARQPKMPKVCILDTTTIPHLLFSSLHHALALQTPTIHYFPPPIAPSIASPSINLSGMPCPRCIVRCWRVHLFPTKNERPFLRYQGSIISSPFFLRPRIPPDFFSIFGKAIRSLSLSDPLPALL